jgi:hypothetical protein
MTKWRDTTLLRVQLADAMQRVFAWRVGLGGLAAELGRPSNVHATELRARLDDTLRALKLWRNELDALIALLDDDDRPTPVHPYALNFCAGRKAQKKGKS